MQHADFLEAWFCHTPGIKVVMPSHPADAYGPLCGAIDDEDPVIFVEHLEIRPGAESAANRSLFIEVYEASPSVPS